MATTHEHIIPITISVGEDELEIAVECTYTITAGSSASWEHPGDPAEINFDKVEVVVPNPKVLGGKSILPAPNWLADFITNSAVVTLIIGEASEWGENDGPDPDDMRDRAIDDKLTERAP
jgi:hypothetical protein